MNTSIQINTPPLRRITPTENQRFKELRKPGAMAVSLALAAILLLTGCSGKYTGGGFIDSTAGEKQKATFGFNLELIDEDGDGFWDLGSAGKGQFTFTACDDQFAAAHAGGFLSRKSISPALGTSNTPSCSRLAKSAGLMLAGSR